MRPIQMVDTRSQYLKLKAEIDHAVLEVLDSSAFINGKPVQEFARNLSTYIGVKHTIPCANGTDALQIALMALDLQPGDEVITPSFTFIATTEVIALLRLTPVFVEVDPKTFCMDVDSLEKAITPKTKAIVPVHLYGQSAAMEEILAIANKHNIPVIEDNAQALGASYTFSNGDVEKTGAMGLIGTTSFYPSKNLGAYGDGGAIFTNDDVLADKIRMITNHGMKERYYYEIVGCNSRLDTVQAAILDIKLHHLDSYNKERRALAGKYDAAFAGNPRLTTPYRAPYGQHVFHQYTVIVEDGDNSANYRNALIEFLGKHGVPSMLYYPVPGHKQLMFAPYATKFAHLPVTDWLTNRVLSLPMHTEMDDEQVQYIVAKVNEFTI